MRARVMTTHSNPNKSQVDDDVDVDSELDFEEGLPELKGNEHNRQVRQRIYDLLEKKRLKELLDDTDDWDV
jgi:hypothetical protein